MDIGTARARLAAAILAGRLGEFAVDYIRDEPNAPGCIIYPDAPFDWRETFTDDAHLRFCVLILVPYIDTEDAQTKLDGYLITVPAAIEADAVFSVTELKSYGVIALAEGARRYLSAELLVEIFA